MRLSQPLSPRFENPRMARRRALDGWSFASPDKTERARELRRAMTPAEQALWRVLRGKALGPRVRPQHVIRGWIVDFYCFAARLVIEVDGDVHDMQRAEDERRTHALQLEGLDVLRVRNDEVLTDMAGVVLRIVEAIHRPESNLTMGDARSPQASPPSESGRAVSALPAPTCGSVRHTSHDLARFLGSPGAGLSGRSAGEAFCAKRTSRQ